MRLFVFSLSFFALQISPGSGQTTADSLAVDSLIQSYHSLLDQGEYDQALQVIEIAKKKTDEFWGPNSALYAACSFNQGKVLFFMGKYEEAKALYLEATIIQEKVLGKEHPDYATSLNYLAIVHADKGEYDSALPLFLEAKTIRAKVLGKEHSIYATSLNNLAILYQRKGDYDEAISMYQEAKNIREKTLGKDHPDYAGSLNNLAAVYVDKGEYNKAVPLYLEALSIWEKEMGKESSDFALGLDNLANAYYKNGGWENALPLYLEAKSIRAKVLGKEHPHYASTVNNLAILYHDKGEYNKAILYYQEAKSVWEKVLGKEHPHYALILNNIASAYADKAEYDDALSLYLEANAIWEKILGKEHPDYALSLSNLALTYRNQGDHIRARHYFLALNTSSKTLLQKTAAYSSEKEMLQYRALFEKRFDALLQFTQNQTSDSLLFAVYDNALFLNNWLLFNAIAREKGIHLTADSSTRAIYLEWKSCGFQLAQQYALLREEQDLVLIAELEERANDFERELIRRSPTFAETRRVVSWQEVQQNLKPDEAAIEFVHYQLPDKNLTDSTFYAALIIYPNWPQPRMVHLFEQRELQPLLVSANNASTVGQLYATRGNLRGQKTRAGRESNNKTRGEKEEGIVIPGEKTASLYQLVWEPIDSLLSGVKTVYFAPSGLLHRLDLAAIAVPGTDQILADKYELVQMGSTRQLVVKDHSATPIAQTATLFGGIKYDLEKPDEIPDSLAQTKPSYAVAALHGDRGGDAWNYLPGTEKEVKNAAKTLGKAGYTVRALSGYEGSEAAFKMMGKAGHPAPRVLHIATHGFFFPDPKDTTQQRGAFSDREPVFKTSDNPLLRSGLVLAGANPAWAGEKPPEGQEDGILTAYEISQMNLSGTELVVLSACETGLGDVEGNEGVYGLKRSFKIAGAKYLIMSLWQVPDQQTQELMSAFYKNWLEGKMSIPKAFAAAQQTMRKRYEDPFFWAGFVLVE